MTQHTADEILAAVKDIEDQIARHEEDRETLPDNAFADRLAHKEQIDRLSLELRTMRAEAREQLEGDS